MGRFNIRRTLYYRDDVTQVYYSDSDVLVLQKSFVSGRSYALFDMQGNIIDTDSPTVLSFKRLVFQTYIGGIQEKIGL